MIGSSAGRGSPLGQNLLTHHHWLKLDVWRALSYLSFSFFPVGATSLVSINIQPHRRTHKLNNNILMDVNSLYNTGNIIAELRAPVNNRENDEIIICCLSGEDGCSLRRHHTEAALQQLSLAAISRDPKLSIDGSREALTHTHHEVKELLYQYI